MRKRERSRAALIDGLSPRQVLGRKTLAVNGVTRAYVLGPHDDDDDNTTTVVVVVVVRGDHQSPLR